jgi:hypothetical protein
MENIKNIIENLPKDKIDLFKNMTVSGIVDLMKKTEDPNELKFRQVLDLILRIPCYSIKERDLQPLQHYSFGKKLMPMAPIHIQFTTDCFVYDNVPAATIKIKYKAIWRNPNIKNNIEKANEPTLKFDNKPLKAFVTKQEPQYLDPSILNTM